MTDTFQQYPLGYLYATRAFGRDYVFQATSRDHDGSIHGRIYAPGTIWHGVPHHCHPEGITKLDKPIPADGWSIVRMVEPGEKLDASQTHQD